MSVFTFCTKKIVVFTIFILCSISHLSYSQYKLNFGLTKQQPENTLPIGKAPFDKSTRKKKVVINSAPVQKNPGEYLLNKGWEMSDALSVITSKGSLLNDGYNTAGWYNATVPGTVLTTLVDQGVYPDPYVGLNNMAIPDTLCRQNWWYRLSFKVPVQEAAKTAWLHFDGINYKAHFFLNGVFIGQTVGAFKHSVFNVTSLLKKSGNNILAVQIFPPPNPGIPHEQSLLSGMGPNGGQLCLDGPTFISSEGWDWVPGIRDRNIGIWQNVRLKFTGAITISNTQIITNLPLPDTTVAELTLKTIVTNNSTLPQTATIKATFEGVNIETIVRLNAGEFKKIELTPATHPELKVKKPKLWWPNGYGQPYLYHLIISAGQDDTLISDQHKLRFGIREYSYELMADAHHKKGWRFEYSPTDVEKVRIFDNVNRREFENKIFIPGIYEGVDLKQFVSLPDTNNPFLILKVNGQKIFCRGGNWGMDDGMKKVSRENLEPAFLLHKEANYNMIRNWTGESTEEVFYELADEFGMLIWNDFWTSTEGYNLNPLNQKLFLENSLDVIRRFRNHPSIAIWCPRNEGYAPSGIEDELYQQLVDEDGTRHYIGNSREINLRQSGDWHFIEDPKLYYTKYAEGFSTEIGTFSIPVSTTLKKFIKPQDQWPINDVWHYHDLHSNNQNLQGYLTTIDSLYGKSDNMDEFSRKVQMVNYESHRAIFEAWNHKMWDRSSGVLLWMTHPAWPSMIWQTYSSDFETHGAYFGAKKACEPVHIQMNLHDNKVIGVNTTLQNYKSANLIFSILGLNGESIFTMIKKCDLLQNSKTEIFTPEFAAINLPEVYLVRLQLTTFDNKVLSANEYWKSNKETDNFLNFNKLPNVLLSINKIKSVNGNLLIEVENKSASPALGLKLNLSDANNNILLPAYFSDGYFTLMPSEKRQIEIKHTAKTKDIKIRTEGYNSLPTFHSLN